MLTTDDNHLQNHLRYLSLPVHIPNEVRLISASSLGKINILHKATRLSQLSYKSSRALWILWRPQRKTSSRLICSTASQEVCGLLKVYQKCRWQIQANLCAIDLSCEAETLLHWLNLPDWIFLPKQCRAHHKTFFKDNAYHWGQPQQKSQCQAFSSALWQVCLGLPSAASVCLHALQHRQARGFLSPSHPSSLQSGLSQVVVSAGEVLRLEIEHSWSDGIGSFLDHLTPATSLENGNKAVNSAPITSNFFLREPLALETASI